MTERTPLRAASARAVRPRILVVAGHDPSGAGIAADRAALAGLSVELVTVVTAYTDQDDQGVRSIGAREVSAWLDEARAALEQPVDALKLGLLPGRAHVEAAARLARELLRRNPRAVVVADPVLAASCGVRFLDAEAVEAIRGELCGAGVILTPNLPEAGELARLPLARLVHSAAARREAASLLVGLGLRAVVLKGGHGDEDPVRDAWADADGREGAVDHARVPEGKLRGSGCRFATRLTAAIALGRDMQAAVAEASALVSAEIQRSR